VFGSSRKGNVSGSEIYVIPAAGGTPVELQTGFTSALSPAWSPDGRTIAFLATDAEGSTGIYLVDATGGNVRRIAPHDGSTALSWSPDGSRIACQSTNLVQTGPNEATGYMAISVVNVADGTSAVVRATEANNRTPAWSPDGSTIAFILEETGAPGQLALMDPDGSDVRILGVAEWSDMGLAWLP
jgi:TolB protein